MLSLYISVHFTIFTKLHFSWLYFLKASGKILRGQNTCVKQGAIANLKSSRIAQKSLQLSWEKMFFAMFVTLWLLQSLVHKLMKIIEKNKSNLWPGEFFPIKITYILIVRSYLWDSVQGHMIHVQNQQRQPVKRMRSFFSRQTAAVSCEEAHRWKQDMEELASTRRTLLSAALPHHGTPPRTVVNARTVENSLHENPRCWEIWVPSFRKWKPFLKETLLANHFSGWRPNEISILPDL